MQNYNYLINESIPGRTPEEKFNNLQHMKEILLSVAYPRRGVDDRKTLDDIALIVQSIFDLDDLTN